MTTETQPEQPILSDEEDNLEEVGVQPTPRRMAYKTVLVAVVIGILAISALWVFMIRQDGSPVYETPVTEPDAQVYEDSVAKALPAAKTDPVVESISRKLVSMSGQIDRSFEVQQINSTVVRQEFTAMTKNIQTIKAAIAALGETHKKLGRKISAGLSRLDALAKDVRALKVVKRKAKAKAKRKPRPVKTPPFQLDAIDVWDDVTYVAVSQAGRVAFLKTGEQQSGWTVTRIDHLKGQVDFRGPAGQVHSVTLPR